MKIRLATMQEAAALTELALESKRFWGYDDDFMDRCRSELVVREGAIAKELVFVAENAPNAAVIGFYSLKDPSDAHAELDMLFVDPEHIREGVGTALMKNALEVARRLGCSTLRIESDPYAAMFYERQGATLVGTAKSVSTGRDLPLFEMRV